MVLLSPLRWFSPLRFLFAPLRWLRRIVSLIVLAGVAYLAVSGYDVVQAARHLPQTAAAVRPVDAIVVLGAPLVGRVPGPELVARLEEARALYEAGSAPRLIVAGTAAARSWLAAGGVPAAAVSLVVGPGAPSALSQVAALLGPGSRVVVVTDALDALYVERLGSGVGLSTQVAAAVGSARSLPSLVTDVGPLWRETSAVAVGRVIGYGRVSWAPA